MDKYIPVLDIDELNFDKIIIDNSKNYNVINYNYNDMYNNIPLKILIKDCSIFVKEKEYIFTNNSKLLQLRNILDKLIQKINIDKQNIINKYSNGQYVKLNFNKNVSKAYLHPPKKLNKQVILVKCKEDFINIFSEYYPCNKFNNNLLVTADLIVQPYFLQNNNFCSLAIYDADIGYEKLKKHIINNNLIKEEIYNNSQTFFINI